jgi:hypothetical protein
MWVYHRVPSFDVNKRTPNALNYGKTRLRCTGSLYSCTEYEIHGSCMYEYGTHVSNIRGAATESSEPFLQKAREKIRNWREIV